MEEEVVSLNQKEYQVVDKLTKLPKQIEQGMDESKGLKELKESDEAKENKELTNPSTTCHNSLKKTSHETNTLNHRLCESASTQFKKVTRRTSDVDLNNFKKRKIKENDILFKRPSNEEFVAYKGRSAIYC
jgi:hypothetical protein